MENEKSDDAISDSHDPLEGGPLMPMLVIQWSSAGTREQDSSLADEIADHAMQWLSGYDPSVDLTLDPTGLPLFSSYGNARHIPRVEDPSLPLCGLTRLVRTAPRYGPEHPCFNCAGSQRAGVRDA